MADDISLLTSTAHSAAAIAAAAQLAQRPEELSILLSTAELSKNKFPVRPPCLLQEKALASAADVAQATLKAQEA